MLWFLVIIIQYYKLKKKIKNENSQVLYLKKIYDFNFEIIN